MYPPGAMFLWLSSLTTEWGLWPCKRSRPMLVMALMWKIANLWYLAIALLPMPLRLVAMSCLIQIFWTVPLKLTDLRYLSKHTVGLPPSNIQPSIRFLLSRAIKIKPDPMLHVWNRYDLQPGWVSNHKTFSTWLIYNHQNNRVQF